MKFARCLYDGDSQIRLTKDKVYNVLESGFDSSGEQYIKIVDNKGDSSFYYIKDPSGLWFEDATSYIREEKIKKLGI